MPVASQLEQLNEIWKHMDDYFYHKEKLCHAIVLVEVALFASLVASPTPDWYKVWLSQRQGDCLSLIASSLPLLLFVMLVLFFFLALHNLLLMQLRMRRVADAWGDAIRLALTKWSVKLPEDAAPAATPEDLEKHFRKMKPTNWFNKYIFPTRAEKPDSNMDSLWGYVPSALVEMVVMVLQSSYARRFEKTIASASMLLSGAGLAVLFLRIAAYVSH